MDQRTKNLMTTHKVLHPSSDVDRLYVSRKEGVSRLASIKDNADTSINDLKTTEKARRNTDYCHQKNTDNMRTNGTTIIRKKKWEEK